ncbi:MAG: YHS domain-containing (seleno)protein [Endozoicomonas sp.]
MRFSDFKKSLPAFMAVLFTLFQAVPAMAESEIYTSFFSDQAVSGYDTVAYFTEGAPVKGNRKFTTEYMGGTWLFSSAENLDLFRENPGKYAPQYGGYCAWAIAQGDTASADPEQWAIVNGKLYLNYDASVKEKWLLDKFEFIKNADQNWPAVLK